MPFRLVFNKRKVEGKKITPDPVKKAKSDENGRQITIDDCIPRMLIKQEDLENSYRNNTNSMRNYLLASNYCTWPLKIKLNRHYFFNTVSQSIHL